MKHVVLKTPIEIVLYLNMLGLNIYHHLPMTVQDVDAVEAVEESVVLLSVVSIVSLQLEKLLESGIVKEVMDLVIFKSRISLKLRIKHLQSIG